MISYVDVHVYPSAIATTEANLVTHPKIQKTQTSDLILGHAHIDEQIGTTNVTESQSSGP